MTDLNAMTLTHTPNAPTVATLTMAVTQPQYKLFDSVLTFRGKPAIITGVCLMVEPTSCYWDYYLRGEGVDSSVNHADFELKAIQLGTVRKPRIKRPEFQLFDRVTIYTGETGFICGVDMVDSGKNAHWQYNVFGVGISQGEYFCADEFQQSQSAQAA